MNEKDFNEVIMTFFLDYEVKGFYSMADHFEQSGRTIELQGILNELIRVGFVEKIKSDNYRRTKKLENLLDDTGIAYMNAPWSYYLSLRRSRTNVTTPPTNAQKMIKDIAIGLLVTVVGGVILWLVIKCLTGTTP